MTVAAIFRSLLMAALQACVEGGVIWVGGVSVCGLGLIATCYATRQCAAVAGPTSSHATFKAAKAFAEDTQCCISAVHRVLLRHGLPAEYLCARIGD